MIMVVNIILPKYWERIHVLVSRSPPPTSTPCWRPRTRTWPRKNPKRTPLSGPGAARRPRTSLRNKDPRPQTTNNPSTRTSSVRR